MKEAKCIVIVLTITLLFLLPILLYSYFTSELVYNVVISIVTGLIVSIITSLCQYFVIKGKIKDNIFNCYFDMYKTIYVSKHKKVLFHYPILNIYKKSLLFSDELSKYLAEYSGFIPNKSSKLYKKLNPTLNPNFKKFNINNFTKLFFPLNSKKFNELIIPIQKYLEDILTEIDYKRFKNDFTEYKKIFNSLNTKV